MSQKEEDKNPILDAFINPSENASENELENALENDSENGLENAKKCVFERKNAEKTESEFIENERGQHVENAEKMNVEPTAENGEGISDDYAPEEKEEIEEDLAFETEEDQETEDWEFPNEDEEEEEEEEEDVLDQSIPEGGEDKPIDELISEVTGDSVKNLETLRTLGDLVMEKLDDSKAMICSAISGQPAANYTSDKRLNKALLNAFINYFNSTEVKAPTPMGTLLIALALWGMPTLGAAYFHRLQAKRLQKRKAAGEEIEEEVVEAETQSDSEDYSQLKEYKENRRTFSVHKETGCYNRTPKGQFCRTSVADEKPSPAIQKMLDQGYDNTKIRELLYGE
ncbi:hypothetical protein [Aureispira anguillae]|uniref:Uncharacterized protein n=1 Tax=Aureispira anguillae TaxID=2864201 RepID=A0A915YFR7_9BACT|nr:hypothetical protein [Aureispira anguillae]BDS12335.1 hypothetical protein AsAng_0030560 [Aureispira anguillae]